MEGIFVAAPTDGKILRFRGAVPERHKKIQPPGLKETAISGDSLPGNKRQHNGTSSPEQHPSVIDTPGIHRPAARYSLGDMPYLRRKRRMK